ncbi:MAG TPA: histidine kinase, partial [Pseudoduganella sp.]
EEIITREVLHKLGIPEPVANAIEGLRGGFMQIPPETLLDTLLLANHFAPVASPLANPDRDPAPHEESVLDLFVDKEKLERMLAESADDAASMNAALLV